MCCKSEGCKMRATVTEKDACDIDVCVVVRVRRS